MLLLVIILMTGTEAHLNPKEIVGFLEAREADDRLKHYSPEVRCIVLTTDGREYTTREECVSIEKRLHELKGQP